MDWLLVPSTEDIVNLHYVKRIFQEKEKIYLEFRDGKKQLFESYTRQDYSNEVYVHLIDKLDAIMEP